MDESGEHQMQDRIQQSWKNILLMSRMHTKRLAVWSAKPNPQSKQAKTLESECNALWWGLQALRSEQLQDIRDAVKWGLLPVLWCKDDWEPTK